MNLEKAKKITIAIVVATPIIWIIWDVYAFVNFGTPATESRIIGDWAYSILSIPFGCGILCGHWFFQAKETYVRPSIFWLIGIGAVFIVRDIVNLLFLHHFVASWIISTALIAGIIAGAVIWPLVRREKPE
jgi:hypothetical protein